MYALYDLLTGRISQYQSGPDLPDDNTGALYIGHNCRGVAHDYYVVEGAIMQRPTKPGTPFR